MFLPDFSDAEVVVASPHRGEGCWAGAPSVVLVDGLFHIAWREARSLGTAAMVHLATSVDGVHLDEVATIDCRLFHASSFDRPALVPLDEGGWRIYLSCATARSKHWWIDSLTADSFAGLARGTRRIVHPGSATFAIKDPLIKRRGRLWVMWAAVHPLDEPEGEDRMSAHRLVSRDGIDFDDLGPRLVGREGQWDARGVRVTSVLAEDPLVVSFDGRPDRESAGAETTGVAVTGLDGLAAADEFYLGASCGDGSLRYLTRVPLGDGRVRWYAEMAAADGSHDLVTVLTTP